MPSRQCPPWRHPRQRGDSGNAAFQGFHRCRTGPRHGDSAETQVMISCRHNPGTVAGMPRGPESSRRTKEISEGEGIGRLGRPRRAYRRAAMRPCCHRHSSSSIDSYSSTAPSQSILDSRRPLPEELLLCSLLALNFLPVAFSSFRRPSAAPTLLPSASSSLLHSNPLSHGHF